MTTESDEQRSAESLEPPRDSWGRRRSKIDENGRRKRKAIKKEIGKQYRNEI